jgi:hypothetical protein
MPQSMTTDSANINDSQEANRNINSQLNENNE